MKSKRKILIVIVVMLVNCLCACNVKQEEENNKQELGFLEKAVYEEGKDGWVYYLTLEYDLNENGSYDKKQAPKCCFSGVNLKYQNLDGYYIPIRDSKTNEIISKQKVNIPDLIYHDDTRDDINAINDYLDQKGFTDPIEVKDLDVSLTNFTDKELVVRLYNKALQQKQRLFGKYSLPVTAIEQTHKINGEYTWQIGYFDSYGYLDYVDIELIYDGDQYLSDLVEKGNGTEEQKNLNEIVEKMEQQIVEKQQMSTFEYSETTIAGVDVSKLEALFKKILSEDE